MRKVIVSGRQRPDLLGDQSGLSTVEYVIILVLIAALAVGMWVTFSEQLRCALGLANDELVTAFGDGPSSGTQTCAKGQGPGSDPSPGTKTKTPATVGPPGTAGL